jgi:DNA-binding Lrp family transcriptional regulator
MSGRRSILPEVYALHTTNGAWDLVAELRTSSLAEFDRVMGQIRSIEGVVNSSTSLLLRSVQM